MHNTLSDARTTERRKDAYALHFMAHPSSIAFGGDKTTIGLPGTFATCQESRNTYDDTQPANNFMGPTLWSSDLTVFAVQDPHGLGSHLDMLHNSPLCMGIAWQEKNIYWAYGGARSDIVRYNFNQDDGIGNDDHSAGQAVHYVTGLMTMQPEVPSHMVYHASDKMLYVADTGNSRIAKLDTTSGTLGHDLPTPEPEAENRLINDAVLTDFVPAGPDLSAPSGLLIRNEYVYVSDNDTGRISAYKMTGKRVNYLDTGLPKGALMGMAFGPEGKLYFVDAIENRVLRIDVPPSSP